MDQSQINIFIAQVLGLELKSREESDQHEELVKKINDLLLNDFEKLVGILYRMDVSETRLKELLRKHGNEDAAKLIALLMIERQKEKIISRKEYRNQSFEGDPEERW